MKPSDLNDELQFTGATSFFGTAIPIYDDGYGQLFIHRDSMGISGIVRALTWEDAYSICEDEFFPEASDTVDEFVAEYGDDFMEDVGWQEAYGFRPNGPNTSDKVSHGIYAKDPNGGYLDLLTDALAEELQINLTFDEP